MKSTAQLCLDMELSYIRRMGNHINNQTENELIVILPVGCSWAKKFASCNYCGYQPVVDQLHRDYGNINYLEIYQNELKKYQEEIHRITFFVGGSFFDLDREVRLELFRQVSKTKAKDIFIETRPELISDENIAELKNLIPGKQFWVAIGLESTNSEIRNKVHKKGISDLSFHRGLEVLKRNNVSSLIYVFLKPPMAYISEREAFEDAYKTIVDSFELGATAVEIESGYIIENTEMQKIYDEGKYTPPQLWTVLKLLKETLKLNAGIIRLAYFSDTPKPIAAPENCDRCTENIAEILQQYRETLDQSRLNMASYCDCRKEWESKFDSDRHLEKVK